MRSKNVVVMNTAGIHARPATQFVSTASKFKSNITIEKSGNMGSGKSIINILGLGITKGVEIKISAEGEDEKEAVETLAKLVESKFGEE